MRVVGLDGKPRRKPGARTPWLLLAFALFLAMNAILFATFRIDPAAPVTIWSATVTAKALVSGAYLVLVAGLGYAAWGAWHEFSSGLNMAVAFWLAGVVAFAVSIIGLFLGHVVDWW